MGPNTVTYPPDGKVYRGGGLPDEFKSFFHVGKKYRVPGFLATSFKQDVAKRFMMMASYRGESCVLWIINVPRDCMHVNFLDNKTHVQGEEEYLFAPYSPFTVLMVSYAAAISLPILVGCMHLMYFCHVPQVVIHTEVYVYCLCLYRNCKEK
jgi:hypothetical protein